MDETQQRTFLAFKLPIVLQKYYASVAGNIAALTFGSRTAYGKRLLATLMKR